MMGAVARRGLGGRPKPDSAKLLSSQPASNNDVSDPVTGRGHRDWLPIGDVLF